MKILLLVRPIMVALASVFAAFALAADKDKPASQEKEEAKGFSGTNDIVLEVEQGKKAWLLLPQGQLHPTQPDAKKGYAEIDFSDAGKPILNIEGIHNFPQKKVQSEKLWQTLTAEELKKIYCEAGFALLPHERNSSTKLSKAECPFVVLFPSSGLLRISSISTKDGKLTVRMQLKFLDEPANDVVLFRPVGPASDFSWPTKPSGKRG